ncbi:hypothetical protein PoB_003190800 [Plakobranchus ocellatus]|uniref:Uncharacterized protein n=1 Tax=Plakobranchus ocellatus TaxID=259542 RepID=A0AAV4AF26_9GAST|nr:hypothetical protein PoB_003190800 [Plakobranchus ocellatus]
MVSNHDKIPRDSTLQISTTSEMAFRDSKCFHFTAQVTRLQVVYCLSSQQRRFRSAPSNPAASRDCSQNSHTKITFFLNLTVRLRSRRLLFSPCVQASRLVCAAGPSLAAVANISASVFFVDGLNVHVKCIKRTGGCCGALIIPDDHQ